MDIKSKKTTINVALTNSFDKDLHDTIISNSVCAVIDTLRATSSISTVFGSGCERIILTKSKDEAYRLKKIFKDYILCGEEEGLPPEGFDYGNSPYEFSGLDLTGKKIIMMTTNGTVSFFRLLKSEYIFSLSLLNLSAVLRQMSEIAKTKSKDIFILCSGKKGHITYDDVYNAGVAVKYLLAFDSKDYVLSDSAQIVFDLAMGNNNVAEVLENSCSGQAVKDIGHDIDIKFCSVIDKYDNIQILKVIDLNNESNIRYTEKYKDILSEAGILKDNGFEKLLLLEDYRKVML